MTTEPFKPDKFTSIYGLWAGGLLLLYALVHYLERLHHSFPIILLLLLATIIVPLSLLAILIWNAFMRRWRRCVSIIAGPVVAVAVFSVADDLGINADRLRFELVKSYYMKQTAEMPREGGEPLFARFDWGDTGWALGPNIFYHLIFDESDELVLSPEQRSQKWNRRVEAKMHSIVHPGDRCSI